MNEMTLLMMSIVSDITEYMKNNGLINDEIYSN